MAGAFDSGMAKIIRAMKHHKLFEDCIAEYARSDPYIKLTQPNGKETLNITKLPPIDISILAGEVIYQLRSALDHFFYDIIQRNGPPLTSKQLRSCCFPLRTQWPLDGKIGPVGKTDLFCDYQRRIPDEAFAVIENLQPYNRGDDGHQLLRMLAIFANIDKHRHLVPTITRIDRRHSLKGKSGVLSTVIIPMMEDGAELYEPWHDVEPNDAMEVEDEYIIAIAFNEPEFGPPQTAPIEDLIYHLPTWVFRIGLFLKKFLS